MELNHFIVEQLKLLKCEKVFYVPGGAAFHLIDAISKCKFLNLVPTLHEQAAIIAAEAYYKSCGKIGVVLVTAGPGLSNISTGLLSCFVDRIPVIILSGQAQSKYLVHKKLRIYGPQAVSAKKLYQKYCQVLEVHKNIKFKELTDFIFDVSTQPYGPYLIQVPLDLQKMNVNANSLKKNNKRGRDNLLKEELNNFKLLITEKLKVSSRPILLLGGGLRSIEGKRYVKSMLNKTKIPTLLSWAAKDLINFSNQNFCGLPGYFCNRGANTSLHYSDLLIVIGTRLDPLQTGYQGENFYKQREIIIVDIDEQELDKHPISSKNKFKIESVDALDVLNICLNNNLNKFSGWTKICRNFYLKTVDEMVEVNKKPHIDPYNLINKLSYLNSDIYIAGSSGGSAEISFLNFRVSDNQIFLNSPGLGGMGFAIPSILGALESNTKASVICVVGDGGLQMNIQELASISRYKDRKVMIIVLNNNGYDSMRRSLMKYFGNADFVDKESGLLFPNLRNLSKAYSLDYFEIRKNTQIEADLKNIWTKIKGPTLVNTLIRKSIESFPKLAPKMNKDGSIESGELIDFFPERNDLMKVFIESLNSKT